MKIAIVLLLLQAFFLPGAALAQVAKPAADIHAAIREEGMKNSQILKTLHVFTDVYGPRLTGSPNLKAAGEWAVKQMKEWGFDRAELEPWEFGHPGWVNERASGFIISPVQDSLVFEVLAWTPSTKGAVSAQAFNMVLPERPTQAVLTNYLNSIKAKVRGRMVLYGNPVKIPVNFEPPPKRISDEVIRRRFDPTVTPTPFPTPSPQAGPTPRITFLTGANITEQVNKFLIDNGALVRINDAGREHGQIRAFNNGTFDVRKVVPTVVLRNEDFGRIVRLLNANRPVTLSFDIRNRNFPAGKTAYNTIGEIAGSDKKDEVIMLGGHLDSWHAATERPTMPLAVPL